MNPRNVVRFACQYVLRGAPYQMADPNPSHFQVSTVCLELNPIAKG